MRKVFLSGPIRGLPREQSLSWRIEAIKQLGSDFTVRHALRGREEKETLPDPRLAVQRDKRDIRECDIMLVNDTFPNVSSVGTFMEILYAHEREKLVIVFGDAHTGDYFYDAHIHVRFDTLEQACEFLLEHYRD